MRSLLALLLLCGSAALPAAGTTPVLEGLQEVKTHQVDKGWLHPGADFSPYTAVLIDPAEVTFRKNWVREINRAHPGAPRIREADANEIAAAAREGFGEIFAEAYRKAGYVVATAPGPNVLRLSPAISDLYIDAPSKLSDMGARIYSVEAGEAVLILIARDSQTGALLGAAMDGRAAGDRGGGIGLTNFEWRTRASNRGDFARLFKDWAGISVKALTDLKAARGTGS